MAGLNCEVVISTIAISRCLMTLDASYIINKVTATTISGLIYIIGASLRDYLAFFLLYAI